MGKAQNYLLAKALQGAVFLLWFIPLFIYGHALPTWLIITLTALIFITIVGPSLVFAFGPPALLARFPAVVVPDHQELLLTLVIWAVGFGLVFLLRGMLSELMAQLLLGFFLVGGLVNRLLAPLGYGRAGRKLTEAAKRDERDSWRN